MIDARHIPKHLRGAAGIRLLAELERLLGVLQTPTMDRPAVEGMLVAFDGLEKFAREHRWVRPTLRKAVDKSVDTFIREGRFAARAALAELAANE